MIAFVIKNKKNQNSKKPYAKSYTILSGDDFDVEHMEITANYGTFNFDIPIIYHKDCNCSWGSVSYYDYDNNRYRSADIVSMLFKLTRQGSIDSVLSRYRYYTKYYIKKFCYRKDVYIEIFADRDFTRRILRVEWDDVENKWFITFEEERSMSTYRFYLNKAWIKMDTEEGLIRRAKMLAVILSGSTKFLFEGVCYHPDTVKSHKELMENKRKIAEREALKRRQLISVEWNRKRSEELHKEFIEDLEDIIPEFLTSQERTKIIHHAGKLYGNNNTSNFPLKVQECILYQNYDNPFKINDCLNCAVGIYKGYLKGPSAVDHYLDTDARDYAKVQFLMAACKKYDVFPPNQELKERYIKMTDAIDAYVKSQITDAMVKLARRYNSSTSISAPTYDVEYDDDELFADEIDEYVSEDDPSGFYELERSNIYSEFYQQCPYSWSDDYAISRYIPDNE